MSFRIGPRNPHATHCRMKDSARMHSRHRDHCATEQIGSADDRSHMPDRHVPASLAERPIRALHAAWVSRSRSIECCAARQGAPLDSCLARRQSQVLGPLVHFSNSMHSTFDEHLFLMPNCRWHFQLQYAARLVASRRSPRSPTIFRKTYLVARRWSLFY